MIRWLNLIADMTFLILCALSVIGASASVYRLMTQWRQGWMLW